MKEAQFKANGWTWTDAWVGSDPRAASLGVVSEYMDKLSTKFDFHPSTIDDCLLPHHLPKTEHVGSYIFIILRYCMPKVASTADTMQELTSKLMILIGENDIITIHKVPFNIHGFTLTNKLQDSWSEEDPVSKERLLNAVISDVLESFRKPLELLSGVVDLLEISLKNDADMSKALYAIRRRAGVYQRLLHTTEQTVKELNRLVTKPDSPADPYLRDLIDTSGGLIYDVDNMLLSTNDLLNLFFNLSSFRTNRLLYVLTIITSFFTPLTFMCGYWGMNFSNVPEFEWKYGYIMAICILFGIAVVSIFMLWWNGYIGSMRLRGRTMEQTTDMNNIVEMLSRKSSSQYL